MQQIFNLIEESCPDFFLEDTLRSLLCDKGYSFLAQPRHSLITTQPIQMQGFSQTSNQFFFQFSKNYVKNALRYFFKYFSAKTLHNNALD